MFVAGAVATFAALYASYDGLWHLAAMAGWGGRTRKALPGTVDVIAVASGVLYALGTYKDLVQRGAVWCAAVSFAGNAIYHVYVVTGQNWDPWIMAALAVLVGAVPALGIAYVVHLISLLVGQAPAAPAAEQQQPFTTSTPTRRHSVLRRPSPKVKKPRAPRRRPGVVVPMPRPAATTAGAGAAFPATATLKERGLALVAAARARGERTPTPEEMAIAIGCTERHARNILSVA
ncbi:hypothetical protein ACFV4G_39630 [Kitasatospora sp. NPDC059747]|uniref:hypothetical protein n=1 Tax=Kitasatospora sp. NPDC059747 TaxID=3346930 RepID=UPI003668206E